MFFTTSRRRILLRPMKSALVTTSSGEGKVANPEPLASAAVIFMWQHLTFLLFLFCHRRSMRSHAEKKLGQVKNPSLFTLCYPHFGSTSQHRDALRAVTIRWKSSHIRRVSVRPGDRGDTPEYGSSGQKRRRKRRRSQKTNTSAAEAEVRRAARKAER